MQFEFYVLNYDSNRSKARMFNIFSNTHVQEHTEKAVRKYLRSPKNYKYESFCRDVEPIYGFDALVKEIDSIIRWQEWGRYQYEIGVGSAHSNNVDKFEKWDCYQQAKPNMNIIAYEVIRQYKQQKKAECI